MSDQYGHAVAGRVAHELRTDGIVKMTLKTSANRTRTETSVFVGVDDTDVLAWKDFMVRTKPHIRICSGKNELT